MINNILILISFFTLVACSSVDENIIKTSLPNGINLELHMFERDFSQNITFIFTEPKNDKANEPFLKTIDKLILKPNYSDSLKMQTAFNTVIYKDKLSFYGIFTPEIKSDIVLTTTKVLNINRNDMEILRGLTLEIHCKNEMYKLDIPGTVLTAKKRNSLRLIPIILSKDENKIEFGVLTYRYHLVDEEYIPNSETIRLEVINFKDKPIYNSQIGMNYMQVITPVYPDSIGGTYLYKDSWNFKDNDGNSIVPGKYTINMTIPAFPKPYRTELFYERK